MSATIVMGAQWGDEGKGKIVDYLVATGDYSAVVRYQGGANAGHTVVTPDGTEFKFSLLPSSILHPEVESVLGNGVVVDIEQLVKEITNLPYDLSSSQNFLLSDQAHVVIPAHKLRETVGEISERIGTTKKGIGPCYVTKAERTGIRVQDFMMDSKSFLKAYTTAYLAALGKHLDIHLSEARAHLSKRMKREALDLQEMFREHLEDYVGRVSWHLNRRLDAGQQILLEGAQGSMLDLDHGDYPYVTSSNPTAGGACVGAGVSPMRISRIIGVVKAYSTRVGEGPFPSELRDLELAEKIRSEGGEYGVVTGRARRIGWLDLSALKDAAMINGFTDLALTKVDVLQGINTHVYRRGVVSDKTYSLSGDFDQPGASWELMEYIAAIEDEVGAPVTMLGYGQARNKTLVLSSAERAALAG